MQAGPKFAKSLISGGTACQRNPACVKVRARQSASGGDEQILVTERCEERCDTAIIAYLFGRAKWSTLVKWQCRVEPTCDTSIVQDDWHAIMKPAWSTTIARDGTSKVNNQTMILVHDILVLFSFYSHQVRLSATAVVSTVNVKVFPSSVVSNRDAKYINGDVVDSCLATSNRGGSETQLDGSNSTKYGCFLVPLAHHSKNPPTTKTHRWC